MQLRRTVQCAGVTAFRVHRMLQPRQKSRSHASVTICRDVSYGSKPRTVMDIYIPGQAPLASAKASQQLTQSTASVDSTAKNYSDALRTKPGTEHFPVALFCHGGVWATGTGLISVSFVMRFVLHPQAYQAWEEYQQNFAHNS